MPLDASEWPDNLYLGVVINYVHRSFSDKKSCAALRFAPVKPNRSGCRCPRRSSADSYATKDELPGLCVTEAALSETSPLNPCVYLSRRGSSACGRRVRTTRRPCRGGHYRKLPDLTDTPEVLGSLAVNASGELTFNGIPVRAAPGTGLFHLGRKVMGPAGQDGAPGRDGAPGQDG